MDFCLWWIFFKRDWYENESSWDGVVMEAPRVSELFTVSVPPPPPKCRPSRTCEQRSCRLLSDPIRVFPARRCRSLAYVPTRIEMSAFRQDLHPRLGCGHDSPPASCVNNRFSCRTDAVWRASFHRTFWRQPRASDRGDGDDDVVTLPGVVSHAVIVFKHPAVAVLCLRVFNGNRTTFHLPASNTKYFYTPSPGRWAGHGPFPSKYRSFVNFF